MKRPLAILLQRFVLNASIATAVAACSMQRAQVANDAQGKMIGLTKEQVLACMGPPINKAAEGSTEVWSYGSGNGYVQGTVNGNQFGATGVSTQRFCTVNVTMAAGVVSRVNYIGPTGGLLSQNEQCAYAVANCAR